ncbi:hypothetical protein [[Clostridium] symbiosum]|jgi:hypothetical protein|uniref:hypothetical protein n=1 Tax=Clostridium symbiosum TaxID=1512 RepID=UPI00205C028D|nr:hypothetical protein [[Clostridium] symbiosum]MCR1940064.1 hypothetical protein [[Clostridium] symbiosum]DAU45231.1 MAG TPA: hypothetical protein [Caudoviricetes sp.]
MKKWSRFKLDILYYLSAIDLAITGFAFTVRYVVKHRRIPKKSQKYSHDEIREEIRIIAEELKDKEAPVEGPGPTE